MNKKFKQNLYAFTKYILEVLVLSLFWFSLPMAIVPIIMCKLDMITLHTANIWVLSGILCALLSLVIFVVIIDTFFSGITKSEFKEFLQQKIVNEVK